MTYHVSVIIEQECAWYVALCPELEVVSQGKSVEEGRQNLKEAIELYRTKILPLIKKNAL